MIQQISADLLWSQIVARAWCDERLMKRLLSNPRDVLSEHGFYVPEDMEIEVEEGTEVKVVEDADRVHHFVLPVSPPDELTDENLDGHAVAWCGWCGGCGCRCRCFC